MKQILILFIFSTLTLISCQEGNKPTPEVNESKESAAITLKGGKDLGNGITMSVFSESKPFPDAAISSINYTKGKFTFGISGETYKLGERTTDSVAKMCANSAKGQHIHLIIDNEPYAAKYVRQFDYDVDDGEHHLLAFLSRSYHESIKTNGANVALKVTVEDKTITTTEPIKEPMLFYSRPKGTYVGDDTKNLMLDFFLKNVDISAGGYRVKANINGVETMIDTWQPYYLNGLPMGENTIELSLIDAEGNIVDTPLNPVKRTFTLKADPLG